MQKLAPWLLAGLFAATAAASPVQASACGPYRVAFYETGLLYFKNKADEYVGIDKDFIEELSRRTGCVFVRFMDSRVRIWTTLAEGRLDMTVSGIETPERLKFAVFVPYVANNRNYLLVRNEVATAVRTLQEFSADKSLQLGVVRGFVHGDTLDPWVTALRSEGRVQEVGDLEVLARVFAAGRVDAFLTQPIVWPPLLERNQLDGKVKMLDVAPRDSAGLGLVLSRQRVAAADAARMRAATEAMRADGTLEAIFARYVSPSMARALAARPIEP
jgi:polar amino acid transport system substrate-binding protein